MPPRQPVRYEPSKNKRPLPQPYAAGFELEKWSSRYLHTFHFPGDTVGRHATPRDTLWLMLLNFPNGVGS
jgi:hypothetical protein